MTIPTIAVVDIVGLDAQGPPGTTGPPGPAGPAGPPGPAAGPHAATHQSGGADPLTALDAAVLTGAVHVDAGYLHLGTPAIPVFVDNTFNSAGNLQMSAGGGGGIYLSAPGSSVVCQSPVTAPTVAIGATPAQSGALRLGNAGEIRARNVANTQDARLLMVDNENNLIMGSVDNPAAGMYVDAPGAITMRPSAATASYTLDAVGLKPDTDGARYLGTGPKRWLQAHISDSVAIGASPAQSGALRLGNNQAILMRNGANTGDVVVANVAPDNQLQIGANAGGVTVYPPAYFASSPYVAAPLRVQASVEIGATPAQSGALRLGSDGAIHARNAANTGDNRVIETLGDQLYVGWSGITHANIKTATGDVYFSNTGGFTFTLSPTGGFFPASDGVVDCGHPAGRWNMAHIKTAVAIGATPAQSGALRLGNFQPVMMRNGANTADLRLLTAWTDDRIYVGGGGEAGITLASSTVCPGSVTASTEVNAGTAVAIGATPAQSGALRLGNNEYVKIRNGTNTDDLLGLAASANTIYVGDHIAGSLVLRSAGTVEAPNLILTGTPFLQMTERPAIGNAPANGAYVFLQDNGSGKTQLMIQFATGAAIQLAIQP